MVHTNTHTQARVVSSQAAVFLTSKCEFLLLFCWWEAGLTGGGWRVEGGSKGALPLTTVPSQSCESECEAEETPLKWESGGVTTCRRKTRRRHQPVEGSL